MPIKEEEQEEILSDDVKDEKEEEKLSEEQSEESKDEEDWHAQVLEFANKRQKLDQKKDLAVSMIQPMGTDLADVCLKQNDGK